MRLKLKRPIVFIDVQSTGLDPKTARIVRLSTLKIQPNGDRLTRCEFINPECPIPPGATVVHGITTANVSGSPPFRSFATALKRYLEGADLAGFGIERFALPLLRAEFARTEVEIGLKDVDVIDAMSLFYRQEPRDFAAAYRRFVGGDKPEDLDGAEATYRVLKGQLEQYPELSDDVTALAHFINPGDPDAVDPDSRLIWSQNGEVIINFGRYHGELLSRIAQQTPDYLSWIASNDEFGDVVRSVVNLALRGEVPDRLADPHPSQSE